MTRISPENEWGVLQWKFGIGKVVQLGTCKSPVQNRKVVRIPTLGTPIPPLKMATLDRLEEVRARKYRIRMCALNDDHQFLFVLSNLVKGGLGCRLHMQNKSN